MWCKDIKKRIDETSEAIIFIDLLDIDYYETINQTKYIKIPIIKEIKPILDNIFNNYQTDNNYIKKEKLKLDYESKKVNIISCLIAKLMRDYIEYESNQKIMTNLSFQAGFSFGITDLSIEPMFKYSPTYERKITFDEINDLIIMNMKLLLNSPRSTQILNKISSDMRLYTFNKNYNKKEQIINVIDTVIKDYYLISKDNRINNINNNLEQLN
jgi:hypothetical protein